jgi:hypothetical protein
MKIQEQLLYITELEVKRLNSSKIRCVTAYWEDNTACITFYFQGEVKEEDIETASDVCTYIIAHFPDGLLEESYIRWDYPKPLPEQFLAYKREEKQQLQQ